jgi:hypothetical protein
MKPVTCDDDDPSWGEATLELGPRWWAEALSADACTATRARRGRAPERVAGPRARRAVPLPGPGGLSAFLSAQGQAEGRARGGLATGHPTGAPPAPTARAPRPDPGSYAPVRLRARPGAPGGCGEAGPVHEVGQGALTARALGAPGARTHAVFIELPGEQTDQAAEVMGALTPTAHLVVLAPEGARATLAFELVELARVHAPGHAVTQTVVAGQGARARAALVFSPRSSGVPGELSPWYALGPCGPVGDGEGDVYARLLAHVLGALGPRLGAALADGGFAWHVGTQCALRGIDSIARVDSSSQVDELACLMARRFNLEPA